MSLPRYPAYKDSGVQWLGEVPQHWEVQPIKAAFKIVGGSTPKSDIDEYWEGDIVWITPSDLSKLKSVYISDSIRKISQVGLASCGTSLVPVNSIILSTRAPIGSLALTKVIACTNQGCKSLIPFSSTHAMFFTYVLSVNTVQLNLLGKGTTFLELSADVLGTFKLPVPNLQEQILIAQFLDRETAKIDGLITEQEKLITLLDDKRQAMISHAVTKGLNPNALMKDSGVAWLGEVPKHWVITPIKRIGNIKYGIGEPPVYQSEGVALIRATNVHAGQILSDGLVFVNPSDIPEKRIVWLEVGDIIVVRSGAYTGDSAIITEKYSASIAGFDMVLRVNENNSFFVQYCLLARYLKDYQIDQKKIRAAQPHLNAEEFGESWIILPPLAEQSAIVKYLDQQIAQLDILKSEAQRGIELLKERRSALISAAVTGKIDVRQAS